MALGSGFCMMANSIMLPRSFGVLSFVETAEEVDVVWEVRSLTAFNMQIIRSFLHDIRCWTYLIAVVP